MNKQQRATLAAACAALQPFANPDHCLEIGHKAVIDAAEQAKSVFQEMADEEREKFDNLSEGLQGAENGQLMDQAASSLEAAVAELDNLDLKEDVTPNSGWEGEAASFIEGAIGEAESF